MFTFKIKWEQRDPNGILIPERTVEHECNTVVKAFYQLLLTKMRLGGAIDITDTSGNTNAYTGYNFEVSFDCTAGTGDDTHGVVVGTGTTAVDVTDNTLTTLIAHGTGAGQLSYSETTIDTNTVDSDSETYFRVIRTFTNESGAAITINEVAIYAKYLTFYACIERSLSTYEITAGNSGTCTYKVGSSI